MFPVSREELCWEGGEEENTRSGTEDVRNRSSTILHNKQPPRTRILTISDLGLSLEAEGKLWVRMLLSCCFREGRNKKNKKKKNNLGLKEEEEQVFRNLQLIPVRKPKISRNPFFDWKLEISRCIGAAATYILYPLPFILLGAKLLSQTLF